MADEELKTFKKLGKNGIVQSTFHYHYARLIELLFCVETAKKLLHDPEILSEHVTSKAMVNNYEGVGFAEAPRGTLIHHYKVDHEGIVTHNNMIIATEHNNIAYNMAITQVAKKYVKAKTLQEGMLNRVEAVIRAFDPCLSCATHARRANATRHQTGRRRRQTGRPQNQVNSFLFPIFPTIPC